MPVGCLEVFGDDRAPNLGLLVAGQMSLYSGLIEGALSRVHFCDTFDLKPAPPRNLALIQEVWQRRPVQYSSKLAHFDKRLRLPVVEGTVDVGPGVVRDARARLLDTMMLLPGQ